MGSSLSSAKPEDKYKSQMFVAEEVGGIEEKRRHSLLVCSESRPPLSSIQVALRSRRQLRGQPGEVLHAEKFCIFSGRIVTERSYSYRRDSSFGGRQGQGGGEGFGVFWVLLGFFFLIFFSFNLYKPCGLFIPY